MHMPLAHALLICWPLFAGAIVFGLFLPRFGVAIADIMTRAGIDDAKSLLGLTPEKLTTVSELVSTYEKDPRRRIAIEEARAWAADALGPDAHCGPAGHSIPVRKSLWRRMIEADLWIEVCAMAALLSVAAAPAVVTWPWLAGNLLVMAVLVTVSASDMKCRMIPDVVIVPAIVAAVLYNAWFHSVPWMTIQISLASCVSIYVLMEILSIVGSFFGEPAGGGDSKLLAFVAAWIGFLPALLTIGLALVVALTHVKTRRWMIRRIGLPDRERAGFPVAPYLAVSFFLIRYVLVVAGGAHPALAVFR